MKRCRTCLLSGDAPGITFDQRGVCNYCATYKKIEYKGEPALVGILDRHRKPGNDPECIVTLSGGRDSCYVALKLARDFGLRVLAVNYRNPFTHPFARENIKRVTGRLGLELVGFDLAGRMHERCLRNNLRAWSRRPAPGMIPMICIGCKVIWVKILEIARARNVSLVVSGGNLFEQTSFKRELLGVSRDASLPRYFARYLFGLLREVGRNLRYLNRETVLPTVIGYLFSNPYAPMVRLAGRNIDRVDLFHYLPWVESEVVSRITRELGWRAPGPGTWRFDCKVGMVKELMYQQALGLDEKADLFSKMVREGLISRPEALRRLSVESAIDRETIREVLTGAGIEPASVFGRAWFSGEG